MEEVEVFDGDWGRLPISCDECEKIAAWKIYNKKIKKDQAFCEEHTPPKGTPRIRNYRDANPWRL